VAAAAVVWVEIVEETLPVAEGGNLIEVAVESQTVVAVETQIGVVVETQIGVVVGTQTEVVAENLLEVVAVGEIVQFEHL